MITLIIAAWLGFLWLLVAIGLLPRWTLWMKLSPIAVYLVANFAIFIPLNWTAPAGRTIVSVPSIQIIPSVASVVTEVNVKSWTPVKKGDVLFRLDDVSLAAAVRVAEARLAEATDTLTRRQQLADRGTVAAVDIEALTAQVDVLEAQVVQAKDALSATVVKAPIDGIVPTGILLPGNRVGPPKPVMALLAIDFPIVSLVLHQNQLRHVRPGQPAEAVFATYPGQTFSGRVDRIYLSHPEAEYEVDGQTPEIPKISASEYVVTLSLDLEGLQLPPGSTGQGAVFTGQVPKTEIIRKLLLRTTTWLNFL